MSGRSGRADAAREGMYNMKRALLLVGVAIALAAPAVAQTAAGPSVPPLVLEPEAEAALSRMGASLRAMKSFEVVSDATFERVYPGNHKLQSQLRTTYLVQFPNNMLVDVRGDNAHRRVYYDGSRMSVVGVKAGKYVTFPVSGSIADVLAAAYEDFGLDFPLQDLFRWGDASATVGRPTAGYRIGDSIIGDQKVTHYAFTQPGVDFQVWLDETGTLHYTDGKGDTPLFAMSEIKIPGLHNVENMLTAIAAVWGLVPPEVIRRVANTFPGVEHRIEFVRELDGVRWYNDSIATSPTRTIAGLESFDQKLIIIAGGYDKHLDYTPLAEPVLAVTAVGRPVR